MADTMNPAGIIPMPPDYEDPFAPKPGSRRKVECLHCDQAFAEDQIQYGLKPSVSTDPEDTFWWCPTPGCDGKGMGFDIHVYGRMTGKK